MTSEELDELLNFVGNALYTRRAIPKNEKIAGQVARYIAGNERLSPAGQLEVYREQFWLRHTAILLEDYPGLSGIVGQRSWERLSEEYLTSRIPRSYTLRDLGQGLPEFVRHADWLEHHALCVDMAELEWAYVEVFDAPEVPALDAQKLASIRPEAWERARLKLNPALRLLSPRYKVSDLRRALKAQGPDEPPVPIPEPERVYLVLYRSQALKLFDKAVPPIAFSLLKALRGGTPLSEACARAISAVPEQAAELDTELGKWFEHWGKLGWVTDVVV